MIRSIISNFLILDIKMSTQSKISTFFGTKNKKRKSNEQTTQVSSECAKKSKSSVSDNAGIASHDPLDIAQGDSKFEGGSGSPNSKSGQSSSAAPISPEQKIRTAENKLTAQEMLRKKQTSGLLVEVGQSWYEGLKTEFDKEYFQKLTKFVCEERTNHTIFPPPQQVFTWTNMCDINQVKVVILGQDPYHDDGQAHGLCFSVQKGITPPPSLENMYKELSTDIKGFSNPRHGDLTSWATQGVLLLNAVLTVRAHQANSHKSKGWETFTDAVISHVNKQLSGVVFLLWGAYAQKKGACIDKTKHHILKGVHPSPLSAYRGFVGCKHFSQTNQLLIDGGKTPIDWNSLSAN